MTKFIHLNLHTEFSLVDGLIKIKPLVQKAQENQMPAVGITDYVNLFSLVKFYNAAINNGIKPIIGSNCLIYDELEKKVSSLIFLCKSTQGYRNLTVLLSKAYTKGQMLNGKPLIYRSWINNKNSEDLIVISGEFAGDIGQSILDDNLDKAEENLLFWKNLFPDNFYLEIQRIGKPLEEKYISSIIELSKKYNLPLVATNSVRFLNKEDFDAHEARICINQGVVLADPNRPKTYYPEQYFKSQEEMTELFSDIPSAIENTFEIAKRCTTFVKLGETFLPDFPIPEGLTVGDYLTNISNEGLIKRLAKQTNKDISIYQERLNIELDVIIKMGFPGYFLIVADFIQWAKDNDIPVGPGRGSGAGSLVAYVLGITDLDPLDYDLLFERFLNPERVSMPDFDIDFCMDNRDKVIDYVARKYGRESVSQIITYGTMAAKAVIRDVGRVQGHPYGFVDQIAKLIPFEIGMTLSKALEQEEKLQERYDNEEDVKDLIDLAKKLEGLVRNVGKHAGGVVISPGKLTDFTPLYCEASGENLVTQFDKDDVEAIGLVKFDFLGLRTLTIIKWTLDIVNELRAKQNEDKIDINEIVLDDKKTFSLLKACNTTAVFQLESSGMKDLIKRLQPDCFEDIVALVALFRPGPLQSGMVDDFINRKHGRSKVEYPHPDLEPILKPTYGVILYQEQVMQIAQVLAKYSLGGADLLRRAMGKKKPEEMAKQRKIFLEGSTQNNIDKETAEYIFDLMEKFAGYGFNKSHSAAYALISYQTAWLKTYYPAPFMASVLSSDLDNTEKVVNFINDSKKQGLTILLPNINTDKYKFTVLNEDTIVYGLGAIKGVGLSAIENILEVRESQGNFTDLFDFCMKVDLRKVNRRVIEALIKAGAMDVLSANRAMLFNSIDRAINWAEQNKKNLDKGQQDLFMNAVEVNIDNSSKNQYIDIAPWGIKQQLFFEREVLGLFLSGHPLDEYKEKIAKIKPDKIINILTVAKKVNLVGIVTSVRRRKTKFGKDMMIAVVDDTTSELELVLFQKDLEKFEGFLEKDAVIVVSGNMVKDRFNDNLKIKVDEITNLDQAVFNKINTIEINLHSHELYHEDKQQLIKNISEILEKYPDGKTKFKFNYYDSSYKISLIASNTWNKQVSSGLVKEIEDLISKENLEVICN